MVTCAPTCIVDVVAKFCTWSFRTKKNVKSSQVKFKFQWRPRPPPLGRPPAREIGMARHGATGMAGF